MYVATAIRADLRPAAAPLSHLQPVALLDTGTADAAPHCASEDLIFSLLICRRSIGACCDGALIRMAGTG